MAVVRNAINVVGITPEDKLPDKNNGQIIIYDEIDYIFIPQNIPEIKSIHQIMFNVELKESKQLTGPFGKIIMLDGKKKFKILYTQNENDDKANFIDVETPYNTFFELTKKVDNYYPPKVYVIDAYFELMENNRIYSHLVYLLDIKDKEFLDRNGENPEDKELIDREIIEKMRCMKDRILNKRYKKI